MSKGQNDEPCAFAKLWGQLDGLPFHCYMTSLPSTLGRGSIATQGSRKPAGFIDLGQSKALSREHGEKEIFCFVFVSRLALCGSWCVGVAGAPVLEGSNRRTGLPPLSQTLHCICDRILHPSSFSRCNEPTVGPLSQATAACLWAWGQTALRGVLDHSSPTAGSELTPPVVAGLICRRGWTRNMRRQVFVASTPTPALSVPGILVHTTRQIPRFMLSCTCWCER